MSEIPPAWMPPASSLRITPDEIHIWRIALDIPPADLAWHATILSSDERARADRFHFPQDRARFIAAHSALRAILSRYLAVAPAALAFGHTRFGKPFIQDPPQTGPSTLTFNLSHSHAAALVAVSQGHAIGIDIEHIRPELAEQHIAERFFAPQEVAALRSLPPETQAEAFFNCWTRKEAFVKARGEGLSLPLDRFSVSLAPDQPAALLSVADNPAEAGRWRLQALSPWPGYVAAFAIDCRSCRVATFHHTFTL